MTTATIIANQIKTYMEQYRESWPFSGAILVAQDGKPLFHAAYGYASLEQQVPNSDHTRFGIWSITKSFTAMAIMMLVQDGKVSLDKPVAAYIPEMDDFAPITIRQLLHHQSGLPNMTSLPEYNRGYNKWPMPKSAFFELLAKHLPHGTPGEKFQYNNSGYYLLGQVIEAASGETYADYLGNRIWGPLGMADTGLLTGRSVITGLASAYHASGDSPIPAEFIEMSSVGAAGGMYSTVSDLLKWDQALSGSQLLPQAILSEMLDNEETPYGMGWFLDRRQAGRRIYHGGAYRGFRTELHRYPESKLTVIVLSNYNFTPVTALAEALADIASGLGSDVPRFPAAFALPDEHFRQLAGTYEGYGCKAVVDRNADGIYFVWNDREINPIYPVSETDFHHCHYLWPYSFKQNDKGQWSFLGMSKIVTS